METRSNHVLVGGVVLLLLALNFLPRRSRPESTERRRAQDAFVATLAGLGFGALAWVVMRSDFALPPISGYMVENSHRLGGGNNVVNVILVDFRGYDTFGEITVLGIAALAIFALTQTLLRGRSATVVVEGETGFLVPDAVAMAEAIGRAGAISPERCRVEARARFDEAAMTARYIALYRQLAGAAD